MHPVSYMILRLRISHGSIDIFHVSVQPAYSLVFPVHLFFGGPSRNFLSCLFPSPVLQSKSVNGMQCEGERPDTTIRKITAMTKTRLRGSPCSGLRGSQKGSTVPCPYSVQIRAVSILSEGLVQACCGMPFFILQNFSRR